MAVPCAAEHNGRSVVFIHGWQGNRAENNSGLWEKAKDMIHHGYERLGAHDFRTWAR
jgi:hypothetical protein